MAEQNEINIEVKVDELYREEVFTDRRVGTIQRLTPVDKDGGTDPSRKVLYVGQTQVLTPAGGLPISFEIPANSLEEAARGFAAAAKAGVEDTMRRLEDLRREAASSIIVPEAGGGRGMGPGGGLKMP